jgi:hypothetical protein
MHGACDSQHLLISLAGCKDDLRDSLPQMPVMVDLCKEMSS